MAPLRCYLACLCSKWALLSNLAVSEQTVVLPLVTIQPDSNCRLFLKSMAVKTICWNCTWVPAIIDIRFYNIVGSEKRSILNSDGVKTTNRACLNPCGRSKMRRWFQEVKDRLEQRWSSCPLVRHFVTLAVITCPWIKLLTLCCPWCVHYVTNEHFKRLLEETVWNGCIEKCFGWWTRPHMQSISYSWNLNALRFLLGFNKGAL